LFGMGDRADGAARIAEAGKLGHLLRPEDEAERRDLSAAQGLVANASGRFPDAARHYTAALALSRRNEWFRDRNSDAWGLVVAHTGAGRHEDAARVMDDIRRWEAAKRPAEIALAWNDLSASITRFAAGDHEEYAAGVQALLKRYAASTNADTLARSAWAVGVSPGASAADAAALARRLTKALSPPDVFGWGYWALALLHLRAGDVTTAEAVLQMAGPNWNGRPWTLHPIVAGLCAARRGDAAAARAYLERAEVLLAAERPTPKNPFAFADTNWADRLLADVLAAELRAALAPREPAPPPRELAAGSRQ
jgi:hypothetical protein